MKRQALNLNDTVIGILVVMSEGNPGAMTVLSELIKHDEQKGIMAMLTLDDMNIRGGQVWVGFSDFSKRDIKVFADAIFSRNVEMIKMINQNCTYNHGPIAQESGASLRGEII